MFDMFCLCLNSLKCVYGQLAVHPASGTLQSLVRVISSDRISSRHEVPPSLLSPVQASRLLSLHTARLERRGRDRKQEKWRARESGGCVLAFTSV